MIIRKKLISNLCNFLETEYVALLGQRGIGVKTLIKFIENQNTSINNIKFLSIALPYGMQRNDEFIEVFLERLIEKACKIPPENTLKNAVEEVLVNFTDRSADFKLRKALSIVASKTTTRYLVIVLHALAEAPEAPLNNLLQILRDYHNQREDTGSVGEKLRFMAAGGERLWKLCCHKTADISPFNIAYRVFLDGCSCEELQLLELVNCFEEANTLRCLTDGIPLFVEQVIDGLASHENLLPFFGLIQNHWNSLPPKSQENLKELAGNTISFPKFEFDYNCPKIPDITSPWREAFWSGFIRMENDRLAWRSTIHKEFVINKINAQAVTSELLANQQPMPSESKIRILHLSDIHLGTKAQAQRYFTQLATDLTQNLNLKQLNYLVISGDIANHSTEEEYEAAFELVDKLVKRYGLDPNRIVLVPGNHDLNWELSEAAYGFVPKRKIPNPLPEGRYIDAGSAGALIRDEDEYKKRFDYFSDRFYKKIYNQPYPQEYSQQAILYPFPEDKILFLGLNSCWEIDHEYKDRAGINSDAIAYALDQLLTGNYDDWLKIAIWHHPVNSSESMKNVAFLEQLAVNGFQLGIHGHVHEAKDEHFLYDTRRGLRIIAAGTFGAPVREQVTGIPLQYNLLTLDPETGVMTVETRKKEKADGAWSADARWGDKNNPEPRYQIEFKYGTGRKTDTSSSQPKASVQDNRPNVNQSIFGGNVNVGGSINIGSVNQSHSSVIENQPTMPSENLPSKHIILTLASSPINEARLRLDKEVREIKTVLRLAKQGSEFSLEQREAVRPDDLQDALLDVEPEIVHFGGHGTGVDGLALENEAGETQLVSTNALAILFKLVKSHVQCVILNACYSEVQAKAINEHIEYVIGMKQAIGDRAAINFSKGFYRALGNGKSIEEAFEFGCNAIDLQSLPDYLTPILLKKKTSLG
jgi:calcineurin-like phosphoesterase family protein